MEINPNKAYLSVFAGAGGDDAKDWARMLLSMYAKFADRRKWKKIPVADNVLEVSGSGAYEALKKEAGVHRLVRISPYDAKKLRHTSFALVEILPEVPAVTAAHFNIPERDLRVEFYRSGGPGGQNVNKVETAVRVVHLPTGLSAAAQAERSQAQNREKAVGLLKAKLLAAMEEKHLNEIEKLKVKISPEWGHEIRSYVLHPYQQVKDHSTGRKISQVERVLEGDLDFFYGKIREE